MNDQERIADLEHDLEVARTERNVALERVETQRAVVAAADALVSYMHACKAIELVGRATNPSNEANLRDLFDAYVKARGPGL